MERKQTLILVSVALLTALVASVLLIAKGDPSASTSASDSLPGLSEAKAPWPPEYDNLTRRIADLDIPPPGSERYHVHALLEIYTEGKQQQIPTNIGLKAPTVASLHTHDPDGIVHMEADQPRDFTLGEFFAIWGVKFSDEQLGGYRNDGNSTVQVFVNGNPVTDAAGYVMKAKDTIVVGYGPKGAVPDKTSKPFPPGL